MVLKAKERGGGQQLDHYHLAMPDNDHVELHDVRGFAGEDLQGAFSEADAIARGTRCEKQLFSMSLNPPEGAEVGVEAFEQAINEVERKLGLENQPRAIGFHERDGRRHAHGVWFRIDVERMRANNLSHYKVKLRDVSRKLYLEHGRNRPRGLGDIGAHERRRPSGIGLAIRRDVTRESASEPFFLVLRVQFSTKYVRNRRS